VFQKVCLLSIVALLTAMLIDQRSEKVVLAQPGIEYKVVNAELFLDADGKRVSGGQNARYFTIQDALNEYGKNGWELITAFYDSHFENTPRELRLIFMKK
jgi:Domain of unknown function (DUF4177)